MSHTSPRQPLPACPFVLPGGVVQGPALGLPGHRLAQSWHWPPISEPLAATKLCPGSCLAAPVSHPVLDRESPTARHPGVQVPAGPILPATTPTLCLPVGLGLVHPAGQPLLQCPLWGRQAGAPGPEWGGVSKGQPCGLFLIPLIATPTNRSRGIVSVPVSLTQHLCPRCTPST